MRRDDHFAAIAKDWNQLVPASGSRGVFSTLDWKQIWWPRFGAGAHLTILSLHDAGTCQAVAPLMTDGSTLSFVGGQDVSDYLDFIVRPGHEEESYRVLLRQVAELDWQSFDLHSLAAGSPTLRFLPEWAVSRGYAVEVTEEDVCPRVDLDGDWEAYLQGLDKKDRHELRRKMRRLASAGDVAYERVADTRNLAGDMADFYRLHRLSREEKAEFMTPTMEAFFADIVARFLPEGRLHLYFMTVDARRVSAVICFDEGDELWLYNSGYDPAYSSLSVGLLLKAYCLQEAVAGGKKRFDFLRGRESYKYHLGGKDAPIFRCLVRRS